MHVRTYALLAKQSRSSNFFNDTLSFFSHRPKHSKSSLLLKFEKERQLQLVVVVVVAMVVVATAAVAAAALSKGNSSLLIVMSVLFLSQ